MGTYSSDKHNISQIIATQDQLKQLQAKNKELKEALIDMCYQFAGWSKGGYSTMGLSVLGSAFDILGWSDPQICKESQCDEPGCDEQATCGFPAKTGYRKTCGKHAKL